MVKSKVTPPDSADAEFMRQAAIDPAADPPPPKRRTKPMKPILQTLARIDRLLDDHSPNEVARIVMWLVAERIPGHWRESAESEPTEEAAP